MYDTESKQPGYGANSIGECKRLVIEYSPNISKSFHVGHLRSTIIGAFLAIHTGRVAGTSTR